MQHKLTSGYRAARQRKVTARLNRTPFGEEGVRAQEYKAHQLDRAWLGEIYLGLQRPARKPVIPSSFASGLLGRFQRKHPEAK